MSSLSEIRDGLQQRLLSRLYRGSESSGLVLKGGGAMRVLTESARYTQDRTLPRVYVTVYGEQALKDNKVAALVDERRTAPRDIYVPLAIPLQITAQRNVAPAC